MCCVLSCFSPVQLFATPWTIAHQAPLSMGFSRQEQWSGEPFYPGGIPDLGIKARSPALWADSLPSGHQGTPETPKCWVNFLHFSLRCWVKDDLVFS